MFLPFSIVTVSVMAKKIKKKKHLISNNLEIRDILLLEQRYMIDKMLFTLPFSIYLPVEKEEMTL